MSNHTANSKLIWYFAYGSNLSMRQMRKRVRRWKESKKALLRGWKLVFNVSSKRWSDGTANIVRTDNPNDIVYGAIYLLTPESLESLNTYEGVPHQTVEVESEGTEVDAETYVFRQDKPELKPEAQYLETIADGLRDHSYAEDIIEAVVGRTGLPYSRLQECCFIYLPSKGRRAIWELTHFCPHKCEYCFTSSSEELERNKRLLDAEQKRFLDFIVKMKVSDVLLTGGEPLSLGDTLISIIKSLARNSITYSISTSGSPLHYLEKIITLPPSMKPRRVNLSFDPVDEKNPNFWKSDFSYLDKIIKFLEDNNVSVKLTSVITRSNFDHFDSHVIRLSELARSHKNMKNIAITNIYSIGRGLECENLSLKEFRSAYESAKKIRLPTDASLSLVNFPSQHEPLQSCPAGQTVFSIMPDGVITPCSMLYNLSKSFAAGNLLGDSANTINARLDEFVKGLNRHISEIKIRNRRCMKCKSVEDCGGGCFATMPVLSLDHAERIICRRQPKLVADQQKEIFLSIERPPQVETRIPSTAMQKSKLDPKVENKILYYLTNSRPKTDPAHSLEHIENTVAIARHIAEKEGANEKITIVAAYLHDLAPRNHSMHHFHTVRSARLAQIVLKKIGGFSDEEIWHIQQCIVTSSYGSYILGYKPQTLEAEIVRDADFLEAMGARGVARTFAFGAYYGTSEMGSVEYSPREPPTIFDMNLTGPDHSPIHHFFTKLLKLKDLMLTETGKQLAIRRHAFMVRFLDEYAHEESLGRDKTLQSTLEKYYKTESK